MKTMTKALFALTAGIAISSLSHAASYGGVDFAFQPYIGAKGGAISLDNEKLDADPAGSVGVVAGYEIDSNFGTEFEYMTSSVADTEYQGGTGNYDINTMGAYATYRYNFPTNNIYAKGKLGYAQTEFELKSGSVKDKSMAGGVGLGMNLNSNLSIEGEYSVLPSVADNTDASAVTIGAKLKF